MCALLFFFFISISPTRLNVNGGQRREKSTRLFLCLLQYSTLLVWSFFYFLSTYELVLGFERFQWGVFLFLFAKRKKEKKIKRHWLFVSKGPSLRTLYSFLFLNEEENGNEPTKLLVRHTTAGEVCLCIACPLDVFFRFKFYFAPSSPDLTRLS